MTDEVDVEEFLEGLEVPTALTSSVFRRTTALEAWAKILSKCTERGSVAARRPNKIRKKSPSENFASCPSRTMMSSIEGITMSRWYPEPTEAIMLVGAP